MRLRPPDAGELPALSSLCLRSKAHRGYDEAFIQACRAELTLTAGDIARGGMAVAEMGGAVAGVVQIAVADGTADLLKLFVDPPVIGRGVGAVLFRWAAKEARRQGARRMTIESDPDAAAFYRRMGAVETGRAPSGSIPGRTLPLLELDLN